MKLKELLSYVMITCGTIYIRDCILDEYVGDYDGHSWHCENLNMLMERAVFAIFPVDEYSLRIEVV